MNREPISSKSSESGCDKPVSLRSWMGLCTPTLRSSNKESQKYGKTFFMAKYGCYFLGKNLIFSISRLLCVSTVVELRLEEELLELAESADIWSDTFPRTFRDKFEKEAQQGIAVLMAPLTESCGCCSEMHSRFRCQWDMIHLHDQRCEDNYHRRGFSSNHFYQYLHCFMCCARILMFQRQERTIIVNIPGANLF